ncbi:cache domain-containing sensor histidine kinase [Paenibacillus sp. y28]|uniref:cache domain-containing sensor histidine kinase n=1 Tax=Paenibacillus sp. y28 TaxID=3129110 RepID=UPI0030181F3B
MLSVKQNIRAAIGELGARFSSIRTVLILSYTVIILLCVALVGAISFYISYQTMAERIEAAGLQIVKQIEQSMDNDFQSKRGRLLAPYYDSEYISGINGYAAMSDQEKFQFRQKLGDLFLRGFNITPIRDFTRFQIYYSSGELLYASDNRNPWTADEVRQSDWFLRTVGKDGLVYFQGPLSGGRAYRDEAAYASSILIRDFANPLHFIIVRAEYTDDLFDQIGQRESLSPSSRFVILNERGEQVFSSRSDSSGELSAGIFQRLDGASGSFWETNGGRSEFVSYTESGYSGWKVLLIMPRDEIFGPLDQIKTATLVTALAAFVVTFLISVLFGRRITRPILDLYKTVNRIKRGDFSIRVDIRRRDEIGRIAMNFNDMQDELQTLIETKYVYQIKLQQAELAMLYSQINPHFLYNTLDSIKAMADYYEVGQIGEMSQSLADMFRYNTRSGDEVVTLREELEQINAYMNIQGIRFEDKIRCEQIIDEELADYPLLKMTLQPLVENAVYHGGERKRGPTLIQVIARREGHRVLLTVRDDGAGMTEARLDEVRQMLQERLYRESEPPRQARRGIGVRNVYARYAIRLGEQFDLLLESREGRGTSVTLRFERPVKPSEGAAD